VTSAAARSTASGPGGRSGEPASRPAPGRHVRDRLTLSLYSYFITWGWFLYSFSPTIPLIAREQGITRGEAGLHGTSMALGNVASAVVSARLVARIGRRATLLLAGGVLVAGLAVLLLGTTTVLTLTGACATAIGGSLAISAAQPTLAVHHGSASASAVSEANGVGALFGLVAPLVVGATVASGWGWRPAVGVTAVLTVLSCVLIARLPARGALGRPEPVPVDVRADRPADGAATTPARTAARRLRPGFSRAYWFFWTALIAAIAVENATTFWVADLVGQRTGAGPGIATAALAGLVAGMALMRFMLTALLRRASAETLLVGGFLFASVGWLVVWTATSTAVALVGLVVAGLGYGAQYPLAITLVLRASDGRPDQAQASSSLGLGLAVGIAPFLLGAVADRVGTHSAFLLVPVFLAVGAAAVLGGRRASTRA
jgi:fucose permease